MHSMRYGYRRVYQQLRNEGYTINHKTVQRLMQEMNLKSKVRKVRYLSYRGEVGKTAPNILNRDFKAVRPNQKWATDVRSLRLLIEKHIYRQLWICLMVRLLHTPYLTDLT